MDGKVHTSPTTPQQPPEPNTKPSSNNNTENVIDTTTSSTVSVQSSLSDKSKEFTRITQENNLLVSIELSDYNTKFVTTTS